MKDILDFIKDISDLKLILLVLFGPVLLALYDKYKSLKKENVEEQDEPVQDITIRRIHEKLIEIEARMQSFEDRLNSHISEATAKEVDIKVLLAEHINISRESIKEIANLKRALVEYTQVAIQSRSLVR